MKHRNHLSLIFRIIRHYQEIHRDPQEAVAGFPLVFFLLLSLFRQRVISFAFLVFFCFFARTFFKRHISLILCVVEFICRAIMAQATPFLRRQLCAGVHKAFQALSAPPRSQLHLPQWVFSVNSPCVLLLQSKRCLISSRSYAFTESIIHKQHLFSQCYFMVVGASKFVM